MKLKTKTKIYFLVHQSKEAVNDSGMDSFFNFSVFTNLLY